MGPARPPLSDDVPSRRRFSGGPTDPVHQYDAVPHEALGPRSSTFRSVPIAPVPSVVGRFPIVPVRVSIATQNLLYRYDCFYAL